MSHIHTHTRTCDLLLEVVRLVEVESCSVSVQRVCRVGVGEQLRKERLKDVGKIWSGGGGGGEFRYFGSIIDPLDMEQSLGAKVNTL